MNRPLNRFCWVALFCFWKWTNADASRLRSIHMLYFVYKSVTIIYGGGWVESKKNSSLMGYMLVFTSGFLWGLGGYFVTRMSAVGATSLITAFSGHFFAILPLLIILLVTKGVEGLKISKKGLFYSILLGALTKGVFKLAGDTAITMIGVATSSILMYLAPFFAAIMSVIFFKEKLRKHQIFSLGLNLLGCVLMVTGGNFSGLSISGIGLALGILAGFLYALNTILGKVAASGDDPLTMTFYMLVFSMLTMAIFAKPWEHVDLFMNSTFLFWAIISSMCTGLFANIFFLRGLSLDVDASKVTIITSVEVIVATLSGVFLLSEQINFAGFIGILFMIASIVGMNIELPLKTIKVPETDTI